MFKIKFKRKLKKMFGLKEENLLDFSFKYTLVLTCVGFLLYLATQLALNANLTPKGAKLESLNNEKTVLIETNRDIAQEVARIKSISIIKEITEEEMSLSPIAESKFIYISNESVLAEL